MFITMVTRGRHRPMSSARQIQSTSSTPHKIHLNIILPHNFRLGLANGFLFHTFRSDLPSFLHACLTARPSDPSHDHRGDIWWRVQIVKLLLIVEFSPPASYFPLVRGTALRTLTLRLLLFVLVRLQTLCHQHRHIAPNWRRVRTVRRTIIHTILFENSFKFNYTSA
jgi:hypothetical protein